MLCLLHYLLRFAFTATGTGDNARYIYTILHVVSSHADLLHLDRHDEDSKIPRTMKEINMLNDEVAKRMKLIFTDNRIPVVPSIGER